MFCGKCGNQVSPNTKFCPKCGGQISNFNSSSNVKNITSNPVDNKKGIFVGIGIGLLLIFIFIIGSNAFGNRYYFNADDISESETTINEQPKTKSKYSTAIIYDNTYSGVSISKKSDALDLISKDSVDQKINCSSEVRKIEDEIISKYGITAVNLCELDVNFAKEISNVIKKIYEEYPMARGSITNLTLVNGNMQESYIAAFMPIFQFATASSSSTYPWVIKTQIILNTRYFLNEERLESAAVSGSKSGHFPPNATKYSPVAHEFGHYLSFLAMIKSYNVDSILLIDNNNIDSLYKIYDDFADGSYSLSMIKEAFENYKKDHPTNMSLDEWRGTISKYALAKDNNGDYIFDETIAEAFHDVYLNGDNATLASKYVIAVLKSKLIG